MTDQIEPNPDAVLLDVRLSASYEAEHIPDSVNNCVFEVAFHDRIPADWTPETPILIFGSSEESCEARMALEKL